MKICRPTASEENVILELQASISQFETYRTGHTELSRTFSRVAEEDRGMVVEIDTVEIITEIMSKLPK